MRKSKRGTRNRANREKALKNRVLTTSAVFLVIIIVLSLLLIVVKTEEDKTISLREELENMKIANAILYLANEGIDNPIITTTTEQEHDKVIKMAVVGNIMCENPILEDGYNSESNTYNFSHIFDNIRKYTLSADIVTGNLETNLTNNKYSGTGIYNAPREFARALKDCGFNVLSTANNNCFSYGIDGIGQTIDTLDSLGIEHVGTRKADGSRVLIKEVKGVKIAFLSYTYGLNGIKDITEEQKQYINFTNKEAILQDLNSLEEVDYICVHMHWGNENWNNYKNEPTELSNFLFENGVDMIIGSHPTSIQPIQLQKNGQNEDVFVAYSTGSFISTTGYTDANVQMILNIEITKNTEGKIYLSKVTYTPIYILDNGKTTKDRYELLPIQDTIEKIQQGKGDEISEKTYKRLIKGLEDIEKQLGKKAW